MPSFGAGAPQAMSNATFNSVLTEVSSSDARQHWEWMQRIQRSCVPQRPTRERI